MTNEHRFIHAGPGTGKSTEILNYVQQCVSQGVQPDRILVLTLTNVATNDMKQDLLDASIATASVECSTLHSWALSTLLKNGVLQPSGLDPRILSSYETKCMLWDLNDSFGDASAKARMLQAMAAGWARQGEDQPGWAIDEPDVDFEQAAGAWLRAHRVLLLDQIVPETLGYLRDNPAASELSRYDVVIVDEYQDLNSADHTVIRLLSGNADVLVAGDDDQSIYSFRYAHPDGIKNYGKTHPEAVPGGGNISHRCPAIVIEAARTLLRRSRQLDSHTIKAAPGSSPGQLVACQLPSYKAEVSAVAGAVRQLLSAAVPAGEILVLAPWGELGYDIHDDLNADVAPGDPKVAETFFRDNVIRNRQAAERFATLNLVARAGDPAAWRVVLSGSATNRRAPTYRKVMAEAARAQLRPHELLAAVASGDREPPRGLAGALQWYSDASKELDRLGGLTGLAFLDEWCPEEDQKLVNLREFALPYFEQLDDPAAVFNELEGRIAESDPPPRESDFVRIMSLHKSKGLQAKAVIITGAISGLLPRRWKPEETVLSEEAFLQEQRRLSTSAGK